MTRSQRLLVHAIVVLGLLLAILITGSSRVHAACHPIGVTNYSPTGVAGCERYGVGTASMWGGPGAARNDCVYPWRSCETITVRSLTTGVVITVTPTMFCDCYTTTRAERIVDLDRAMVLALGLDPADGLWPVEVQPASELPDTAMKREREMTLQTTCGLDNSSIHEHASDCYQSRATDYADLRRLAEQATPGPWRVREDGDIETADGKYVAVDHEGLVPAVREEADAAYIAAANPQAILALLDRVAVLDDWLGWALDSLEKHAPFMTGFGDTYRKARALLAAEPAASLDIDVTTQAMWDEKADEIARGDQR